MRLLNELPELVASDIITQETANDIERYYVAKAAPQSNRLLAIFGVLGAILTGLGIILIFAHNWDTFPRYVKTILALLPLVLFQILTAYAILKEKSTAWKQSAGTLLFFSVGASMALIAQIYNIPGSTAGFLCSWTLLCLPIIYLLRANALAVLHVIFSTYYAVEAGYFDNGQPWMYLFFIVALIPFYVRLQKEDTSPGLAAFLNFALPLSGTIVLGTFLDSFYTLNLLTYLAFFGILYGIGRLPFFEGYGFRANGYLGISKVGIIFVLLYMSFRWFWQIQSKITPGTSQLLLWLALMAITVAIVLRQKKVRLRFDPFIIAVLASPLVYLAGMGSDIIAMATANLIVLAVGIAIIRQGAIRLDFSQLNFGLLITSVLIICRFFDTNMSFALRGLLFVAVGAGFFTANYFLIRKKQTIESINHEN